jgi:HEAT repeat protein
LGQHDFDSKKKTESPPPALEKNLPKLKHVNAQTLQDSALIQTALFEMKGTEDRPSRCRVWGSEDFPRKLLAAASEDDDLYKKHLAAFYNGAFGAKTTLNEVEKALESLDDAIKSHDNSSLGKLNRLRTNLAFRRLCYTLLLNPPAMACMA